MAKIVNVYYCGCWDSNPRPKNPWSVDDAICKGISGVLVRLTTCKRLTSLPKQSLITLVNNMLRHSIASGELDMARCTKLATCVCSSHVNCFFQPSTSSTPSVPVSRCPCQCLNLVRDGNSSGVTNYETEAYSYVANAVRRKFGHATPNILNKKAEHTLLKV